MRVARCDASEIQLATEPGDTCQGFALDRSSILRTSTMYALPRRLVRRGFFVRKTKGGVDVKGQRGALRTNGVRGKRTGAVASRARAAGGCAPTGTVRMAP